MLHCIQPLNTLKRWHKCSTDMMFNWNGDSFVCTLFFLPVLSIPWLYLTNCALLLPRWYSNCCSVLPLHSLLFPCSDAEGISHSPSLCCIYELFSLLFITPFLYSWISKGPMESRGIGVANIGQTTEKSTVPCTIIGAH